MERIGRMRVRESGSRVELSSYSSNRASNPRGEEERSSALCQGLASFRTTAESVSVAARCLLPPRFSLSRESGVLPLTFPSLPAPTLANSHPKSQPQATLNWKRI